MYEQLDKATLSESHNWLNIGSHISDQWLLWQFRTCRKGLERSNNKVKQIYVVPNLLVAEKKRKVSLLGHNLPYCTIFAEFQIYCACDKA